MSSEANADDLSPRAFKCPCGSYKVVTLWFPYNPHIKSGPRLSHRCLDCGRQGSTPVVVHRGIASIQFCLTAWEALYCGEGDHFIKEEKDALPIL